MRKLKELLKQKPVFLHNWSSESEVYKDFAIEPKADAKILFASYNEHCYEGNAFVLLAQAGKLFEINGSHCSCFGLEKQFEPEETTIEALRHRLIEGRMGQGCYAGNEYSYELKEFLGIEE